MSKNFENISLLVSGCMDLLANKVCSGCMDLLDYHLVFRLHGPIWSPFCAQVTWTYTISVIICILHSGHMDLFCMSELTAQRDFGFAILFSGHMDLYDCHFVLILNGPIQLAFCTQITWSYYVYSSLKYYNAALCHPHLPFIPTMYTCTNL